MVRFFFFSMYFAFILYATVSELLESVWISRMWLEYGAESLGFVMEYVLGLVSWTLGKYYNDNC